MIANKVVAGSGYQRGKSASGIQGAQITLPPRNHKTGKYLGY